MATTQGNGRYVHLDGHYVYFEVKIHQLLEHLFDSCFHDNRGRLLSQKASVLSSDHRKMIKIRNFSVFLQHEVFCCLFVVFFFFIKSIAAYSKAMLIDHLQNCLFLRELH